MSSKNKVLYTNETKSDDDEEVQAMRRQYVHEKVIWNLHNHP